MGYQIKIRKGLSGPNRWCYTITGDRLSAPIEGAALGTKSDVEALARKMVSRVYGTRKKTYHELVNGRRKAA